MIEDGLFLGLGFCLATLIAIACLPLVWRRAHRVVRGEMALLVPGSQAEVDAAQDGLRAQAAVAQRRLEQRVEAEQRTAALTKSELGHRTVSLVSAEKAGEALRVERRGLIGELDVLSRDMRDSEGQRGALEKALHDADAQLETASVAAATAGQRYDDLSELAEERRGLIAALETRTASLQARIEDGQELNDRLKAESLDHATARAALATELDQVRSMLARATGERDTARDTLAQEQSRAEERDRRLHQRSDALAAAEARMAEQDRLIAQRQAEIATLKQRFAALEAELKARGDASSADSPELAQADALLRSAIVTVGDDALRLLKPASDEPTRPTEGAGVVERQP